MQGRMESGLTPKDIAGVLGTSVTSNAVQGKRGQTDSDDDESGFLDFDGSFEGGNLGVAQARSLSTVAAFAFCAPSLENVAGNHFARNVPSGALTSRPFRCRLCLNKCCAGSCAFN